MKGSKNAVPTGMKRLSKGGHSEKSSTHKSHWFARCEDAPKGEKWSKQGLPYVPPCVPAN